VLLPSPPSRSGRPELAYEVALKFVTRHPDAVALDLGVGLDTRAFRIAPPSTVDWYDIDFGEVITGRQRLLPDLANAHGVGGVGTDLTDPTWLDAIPTDRPAVIVADGLLAFLTQEDMISLLNRLISHFPAEKWPSTATPDSLSGAAKHYHGTQSVADLITGQGDPAHARTRGRRVPVGPSPVHPPGSTQRSVVPKRNHGPAVPLLALQPKLSRASYLYFRAQQGCAFYSSTRHATRRPPRGFLAAHCCDRI
jgi:Leucine carboxyl methyltransferase